VTARLFGVYVFVQTFALLAERDRWTVLFYFTRETWLYVLLLWLKDLALAALAAWAAALLCRRAEALPEAPEGRPARVLVALALAAVAAGVALRWILPTYLPPGLFVDPPLEARALLFQPDGLPWIGGVPLLGGPETGSRTLVSYLNLHYYDAVFRLFGRDVAGFVAVSAIPGCLALLGAWWLARELWGPTSALLGVSFVSLALWPLVFSRWGYIASELIALALLATAGALAALRTRRLSLALFAGACLGLSLHTHASSWAVAAGLGLFSLVQLVRRREARPLVAAAWLAALAAFAPFAAGYLAHPRSIGGRVADVPAGTHVVGAWGPDVKGPARVPATLLSNLVDYTGVLLFTSDPNPRDGLPGRAAATPLLGSAALLGVALSAARRSRATGAFFALLLGSLAAGVFANPGGAPNTIRACVVVIPALLAAGWLAARLLARIEQTGHARLPVGAAGAVALVLVLESAAFLGAWPEDPKVVAAFCPAETRSALLARSLAGGVLVDAAAFRHPFVFDTLSGSTDPRVPIRTARYVAADALAASAPPGPFWVVARAPFLEKVRAAGRRCARGIAPFGGDAGLVVAYVARGGR
jgi:hypothetical protein